MPEVSSNTLLRRGLHLPIYPWFSRLEDNALTSSPLAGPEPSITTANIIRAGRLPQPQLGVIGEIDTAIKTLARTAVVKERVCEYIQNEVST